MLNNSTDQMKVKIIVTKFVQTDEVHFKSVVQNLTGKDSVVAMESETDWRPVAGLQRSQKLGGGSSGGGRGPGNPAVAGPGDLESMIMELPSLEKLRELLAD